MSASLTTQVCSRSGGLSFNLGFAIICPLCIALNINTSYDNSEHQPSSVEGIPILSNCKIISQLDIYPCLVESCNLTSPYITALLQAVFTLTSSNVSEFLARRQQGRKWPVSSTNGNDPRPFLVFSTCPCPYFQQLFTSQLYIVLRLGCVRMYPVQCPVSPCGPILPLNGPWHPVKWRHPALLHPEHL